MESPRHERIASFDAIDARVLGLEDDVRSIDRKLETGLASLRTDFAAAITGIHLKLDQQGKPQWSVIYAGIGVLMTFFIAIGALAYMPIREGLTDMKATHAFYLREAKADHQAGINDLVQRDRRLWDTLLEVKGRVDKMEGYRTAKP